MPNYRCPDCGFEESWNQVFLHLVLHNHATYLQLSRVNFIKEEKKAKAKAKAIAKGKDTGVTIYSNIAPSLRYASAGPGWPEQSEEALESDDWQEDAITYWRDRVHGSVKGLSVPKIKDSVRDEGLVPPGVTTDTYIRAVFHALASDPSLYYDKYIFRVAPLSMRRNNASASICNPSMMGRAPMLNASIPLALALVKPFVPKSQQLQSQQQQQQQQPPLASDTKLVAPTLMAVAQPKVRAPPKIIKAGELGSTSSSTGASAGAGAGGAKVGTPALRLLLSCSAAKVAPPAIPPSFSDSDSDNDSEEEDEEEDDGGCGKKAKGGAAMALLRGGLRAVTFEELEEKEYSRRPATAMRPPLPSAIEEAKKVLQMREQAKAEAKAKAAAVYQYSGGYGYGYGYEIGYGDGEYDDASQGWGGSSSFSSSRKSSTAAPKHSRGKYSSSSISSSSSSGSLNPSWQYPPAPALSSFAQPPPQKPQQVTQKQQQQPPPPPPQPMHHHQQQQPSQQFHRGGGLNPQVAPWDPDRQYQQQKQLQCDPDRQYHQQQQQQWEERQRQWELKLLEKQQQLLQEQSW